MIQPVLDIATAVTAPEADQLQRLAAGRRVLELGAHYGYSTIVLSQVADVVHSVDWHQGDSMVGHENSLDTYFTNLRRYGALNVVTHVGLFEEVLPLFSDAKFDGCFLDGVHDLAQVTKDLYLLHRLVRPGGWIAIHDYGRVIDASTGATFGVDEAVTNYAMTHHLSLDCVDYLAWMQHP